MSDQPVVLGGRYALQEVIGRGGMAEVWRARDTRLDREVAIKRLRVDLATDPTFQARFAREAQSAAGLNHPNIVSVYDTGQQEDPTGVAVPYIVMELVTGQTLRDILRAGRTIVPEKALEYAQGVCEALSYSHKHGIVHRDIKPANVMITPSGQVKVMDFGIARAVADTSATMTQTAAVIGTAQYLSPEQARGETVDARSDIYSVGCLLYELLTGRPPFIGDSPVSVAYQHVRETAIPPSQLDPEITPEMDAITMKALNKAPADRYQNARDMRDDIARLLNGEQVTAQLATVAIPSVVGSPTPTSAPVTVPLAETTPTQEQPAVVASEPARRRRRMSVPSVILLVLLVVLLAVVGFVIWHVNSAPTEPTTAVVPSLVGFQEDAATKMIKNLKLVANPEHTTGPLDTKGQVINQDPDPGTVLKLGLTVTFWINDGPAQSGIPPVIGMKVADARDALIKAGFKAANITATDANSSQEKITDVAGNVVAVSPGVGQQVDPNTGITLYVATGKSPIPDLISNEMDRAGAEKALAEAGFTNVSWQPQTTSTKKPGTVVAQDPPAGTVTSRTNRVTVYLAQPPAPPSTVISTVTAPPPPTSASSGAPSGQQPTSSPTR